MSERDDIIREDSADEELRAELSRSDEREDFEEDSMGGPFSSPSEVQT